MHKRNIETSCAQGQTNEQPRSVLHNTHQLQRNSMTLTSTMQAITSQPLIALHMPTSDATKQRRVRFRNVVRVRPIPFAPSMQLWWTAEDYEHFRVRDQRTVELHEMLLARREALAEGSGRDWNAVASPTTLRDADFEGDTDSETDDFCMRGLEGRTSSTLLQRKHRRWEAAHAVLTEQDYQREEEEHDADVLAECYADMCDSCVQEALHRAYCDEMYVQQYVRRTKSTRSALACPSSDHTRSSEREESSHHTLDDVDETQHDGSSDSSWDGHNNNNNDNNNNDDEDRGGNDMETTQQDDHDPARDSEQNNATASSRICVRMSSSDLTDATWLCAHSFNFWSTAASSHWQDASHQQATTTCRQSMATGMDQRPFHPRSDPAVARKSKWAVAMPCLQSSTGLLADPRPVVGPAA